MCLGGSPKKADTPAAAPPPPADPPKAPLINTETMGSKALVSSKQGRAALRIDLANTGVQVGTGA